MLNTSQDNSGSAVETKVRQINSFARKAQSEISAIATEHRERIKNQLVDVERNITNASETLDEYAEAGYGDEDEIAADEWDDIDGADGTGETPAPDNETITEATAEE